MGASSGHAAAEPSPAPVLLSAPDAARRELLLFVLAAAAPCLAIAAIYQLHPWPTPLALQAAYLSWPLTSLYLGMGALGVAALPRTGAALSPGDHERGRWARLAAVSLAIGALYGASDLAIGELTPWGAHIRAVDARNGYSDVFVNVRPPWSVLHYFHASVLSECAFRLLPILVPTWIVARLAPNGRASTVAFWTFAALAAMIEPVEKGVLLRKWGVFGETPMEWAVNAEGIAWQFVYGILLRRLGWPAPILMRFGYYLVVRAFIQ